MDFGNYLDTDFSEIVSFLIPHNIATRKGKKHLQLWWFFFPDLKFQSSLMQWVSFRTLLLMNPINISIVQLQQHGHQEKNKHFLHFRKMYYVRISALRQSIFLPVKLSQDFCRHSALDVGCVVMALTTLLYLYDCWVAHGSLLQAAQLHQSQLMRSCYKLSM